VKGQKSEAIVIN
jgi:hypothetical protein